LAATAKQADIIVESVRTSSTPKLHAAVEVHKGELYESRQSIATAPIRLMRGPGELMLVKFAPARKLGKRLVSMLGQWDGIMHCLVLILFRRSGAFALGCFNTSNLRLSEVGGRF